MNPADPDIGLGSCHLLGCTPGLIAMELSQQSIQASKAADRMLIGADVSTQGHGKVYETFQPSNQVAVQWGFHSLLSKVMADGVLTIHQDISMTARLESQ
jgi:hypothetical protein